MKMSVWSLTCRQSVFQWYHSENIYKSFTHKMAAKASWHWNYVTVALCISGGGGVKKKNNATEYPVRHDAAKKIDGPKWGDQRGTFSMEHSMREACCQPAITIHRLQSYMLRSCINRPRDSISRRFDSLPTHTPPAVLTNHLQVINRRKLLTD